MTAATAIAEPTLGLTDFQHRALCTPETADLFLGGGRGGGKSYALALLFLRHGEQHGQRARMLFVRRSFPGVVDFEAVCREVFGTVYGTAASYNAGAHLWRFPNGATLQLDQIEGPGDFNKFQGKSYSLIGIDEAGQFPDPAPLDLLRSCLRAPAPMHPRMVLAANPGGPGHGWISRRHVFAAMPWQAYREESTGREFINCPSLFTDNAYMDQGGYRRQLEAACATDPELLRAWRDGDWTVARGAYFSAVLDQNRVLVEPWPEDFGPRKDRVRRYFPGGKSMVENVSGWELYLAHDFGVSAPSVTYVCAESPGIEGPDGRYYPPGSVVLLDELSTHEPNSLERGMGYTVPILSERIRELAGLWGIRPEGVADDACFAKQGHDGGSLADEFKRQGVFFRPAKKGDRLPGWEIMRRMLADAGKPDVPGLYVSRRCEYWWSTVPVLARDPRKPDDVDTRSADHAADACRYALLRDEPARLITKRLMGF